MGPTCRDEAMVAMLILLSSKSCWMSSVPPRMNTSFDSLCGRIINSVAFHESSTCGKVEGDYDTYEWSSESHIRTKTLLRRM